MIDFKDIKDLEKLMKLCRKQGVTELNTDNLSMKFGDLPERQHSTAGAEIEDDGDPLAGFPDGELTQEELTFFANGGLPEDNPYRSKN